MINKQNSTIIDNEIEALINIYPGKIKVIKGTNNALKRKIFNLFKNNAKASKDLKYYLNEANNIE